MNELEKIVRRFDAEKAEITGKLFDALNENKQLRSQLVSAKTLMRACVDMYHVASGKTVTDEGDGYGPLREMRLFLIDDKRRCICQDQHRRGYCTEPTCPYYNPLTSAQRREP